MFKFVFVFILSFGIVSCSLENENVNYIPSEYEMTCESVIRSFSTVIYRCENFETVCYSKNNAIDCFKK